jgi:hypothetical protein
MDHDDEKRMLIVRTAGLVADVYAFFVSRLVQCHVARPRITYAPMSAMDEERHKNLNRIYNFNDVECVNMLRMRRTPFSSSVSCLRVGTCLEIVSTAVWRNKWPCSFM